MKTANAILPFHTIDCIDHRLLSSKAILVFVKVDILQLKCALDSYNFFKSFSHCPTDTVTSILSPQSVSPSGRLTLHFPRNLFPIRRFRREQNSLNILTHSRTGTSSELKLFRFFIFLRNSSALEHSPPLHPENRAQGAIHFFPQAKRR